MLPAVRKEWSNFVVERRLRGGTIANGPRGLGPGVKSVVAHGLHPLGPSPEPSLDHMTTCLDKPSTDPATGSRNRNDDPHLTSPADVVPVGCCRDSDRVHHRIRGVLYRMTSGSTSIVWRRQFFGNKFYAFPESRQLASIKASYACSVSLAASWAEPAFPEQRIDDRCAGASRAVTDHRQQSSYFVFGLRQTTPTSSKSLNPTAQLRLVGSRRHSYFVLDTVFLRLESLSAISSSSS